MLQQCGCTLCVGQLQMQMFTTLFWTDSVQNFKLIKLPSSHMNNEYKLTTAFELEVLSKLVVLPLIHYEIQIYDQLNKGAEKKLL